MSHETTVRPSAPWFAGVAQPPAHVAAPNPPATLEHEAELTAILDGEALHAVYQPLVELASGEVIGYEALVRGPAGSALERPGELFTTATRAGRLAELDWACRVAAMRGALDAGLRAPTRLFVNVEPEAVGVPCPELHRATWELAGGLDVVVEVTERALTSRPAELLHALEEFRERGWSVALDDVGADSRSLALMELLAPDVIKLDLRLIQARPNRNVADIVTAVNAYAERTGAVVLAEGIETGEHLATARSLGASVGQGWHFGRPGPLAPARETPTVQPGLRRKPDAALSGTTPFDAVSRVRPVLSATKPLLLEISWHLERQALALGETAIILSVFQTAERFTPASRRRYARLAETLAFTAGLGIGLEAEPAPGIRGAALADDDVLKDEWSVVVLAPHFAAALVAMDLGDSGPDELRRFEYAVSYDRDLVTAAAASLMRRIRPLT